MSKPNPDKPTGRPGDVTEIILESISEGVFTVDDQYLITTFNRAAERITGVPRESAIGRHCWDVFRSNMCESDCALRRTMAVGRNFTDSTTYIVDAEQNRIPVTVCTSLLKDGNGNVLGGVETFRDMSTVQELRKELEARYRAGDLVSRSANMQRLFAVLPQISESDSTVVVQGETGTGKELLARVIHQLSPRREKPFVAVNCGALPDTLLESELFGYKAGAFTDAVRDKPGHFASAEGGTLFLDEIGDVSPAFQVRLLRVLQEHVFRPLGATGEVRTDVRVIAATNRDLRDEVDAGVFREDLFYRLNVLRLDLPPLRERRVDIPLLVDSFIEKHNLLTGKAVAGISPAALTILMSHDFPGNIRELENAIEYACVLCPEGRIEPHCLPDSFAARPRATATNETIAGTRMSAEAASILEALERNGYNRQAAARDLGIHKSTLFRKIKALGLTLPGIDGRSQGTVAK